MVILLIRGCNYRCLCLCGKVHADAEMAMEEA